MANSSDPTWPVLATGSSSGLLLLLGPRQIWRVEQEGGGEQRPQEHLRGLAVVAVERVGGAVQVVVVDGRQALAMGDGVGRRRAR